MWKKPDSWGCTFCSDILDLGNQFSWFPWYSLAKDYSFSHVILIGIRCKLKELETWKNPRYLENPTDLGLYIEIRESGYLGASKLEDVTYGSRDLGTWECGDLDIWDMDLWGTCFSIDSWNMLSGENSKPGDLWRFGKVEIWIVEDLRTWYRSRGLETYKPRNYRSENIIYSFRNRSEHLANLEIWFGKIGIRKPRDLEVYRPRDVTWLKKVWTSTANQYYKERDTEIFLATCWFLQTIMMRENRNQKKDWTEEFILVTIHQNRDRTQYRAALRLSKIYSKRRWDENGHGHLWRIKHWRHIVCGQKQVKSLKTC